MQLLPCCLVPICNMACFRRSSFFACFFLAMFLPFLVSCSQNNSSGVASTASSLWAVAWGNSPENALLSATNQGGEEQSFRFFLYPTVSGTEERVRFSNVFGATSITIGAGRLAIATGTGAAIDPTQDAALRFNGSASVTIEPGQTATSDPVNITYTFGQKLAVSMYVQGTFPPLTQHNTQVSASYATASGAGDATGDTTGASFTQTLNEWYLLSDVDVYGSYQGTVVLFGSSSIDGAQSNLSDVNAYPMPDPVVPGQDNDRPSDWLARQLNAAGYHLGVLNAGVIADPAGPNTGATPATGVANGEDRMARDVLEQPSVSTVVIYLGAVDIKSADCKSAPDVEAALTNIVSQANAAGKRVILGTLPPSVFCSNPTQPNYGPTPTTTAPYAGDVSPGPENPGAVQWRLVNDWIRTTGATLSGVVAIADFARVMADPNHPDFLLPKLNSGDNTHPNGPGYGVQSSAIPLSALLPSP